MKNAFSPPEPPLQSFKKSRYIKLFLVAAAAIAVGPTLVYLASGDELSEPVEYKSEQECIEAKVDVDTCINSFADSKKQYATTAPKYTSLQECEAQVGVGKCATPEQPSQAASNSSVSSTGFFVPMMAGILLSRVLSGSGGFASHPFYKNAAGGMFTGRCDPTGCNERSSNYVGTAGSGGTRSSYSSAFTNRWRSGSYASSGSASSVRSATGISRGGFGSSFHSSGG